MFSIFSLENWEGVNFGAHRVAVEADDDVPEDDGAAVVAEGPAEPGFARGGVRRHVEHEDLC